MCIYTCKVRCNLRCDLLVPLTPVCKLVETRLHQRYFLAPFPCDLGLTLIEAIAQQVPKQNQIDLDVYL